MSKVSDVTSLLLVGGLAAAGVAIYKNRDAIGSWFDKGLGSGLADVGDTLGKAGENISSGWNDFTSWIGSIGSGIGSFFGSIGSGAADVGKNISSGWNDFTSWIGSIGSGIGSVGSSIKSVGETSYNALKSTGEDAYNGIKSFGEDVYNIGRKIFGR